MSPLITSEAATQMPLQTNRIGMEPTITARTAYQIFTIARVSPTLILRHLRLTLTIPRLPWPHPLSQV